MNISRTAIDQYLGEDDKRTFDAWLQDALFVLVGHTIDQEVHQIANLHSRMVGHAQIVRDHYIRQLKMTPAARDTGWVELTTIEQFTNYYRPKFADNKGEINAQVQLSELKQTGSLSAYILAEAHIASHWSFTDRERKFFFIQGLKPKLQQKMLKKAHPTFEGLVHEVLQEDRAVAVGATMARTRDPDAMDIDAVEAMSSGLVAQQTLQTLQQMQTLMAQMAVNTTTNVAAVDWQAGGRRPQRWDRPRRQERRVTITVEGQTMTVSNQTGWVRSWLRDNRRCFECAGEHQAKDCPLSGNANGRR
ncbi:hypothetical protein GGF48_002750 [Coemansia sp. RSA 921]|nr:hypothetical protein GGF48_002750 [Coemansia sp. RSA 921]KAJ2167505.1 hypothetical protein GGF45_005650 [Coemansia sp. RSA 551]KAJ2244433.1 hypothetical protein GGH97_003199 [Coemansia sp. RSA 475]KAJ2551549.1 hypothetical protein IWW35_002758 [Coemansia sp. RSA 1878]KAJ2584029.1 hypothetical protein IWW49_005119 [Coemansia sp. RSA 1797]